MRGPIAFYIETVDTRAFENAGQLVGPYDAPFLPFVSPAAIGALVMYLLAAKNSGWLFGIFVVTVILSLSCYAGFAIFYYRAVARHRRELGLPSWREKMKSDFEGD